MRSGPAITLLSLLGGCGALTAQLDEPRVCQAFPPVTLPGADAGGLTGTTSVTLPIRIPLDQPGESNVTLTLTDLTLSSAEDGGVLGTLDSTEATVLAPSSTNLTDALALDYTHSAKTPQPDPLVLEGTAVNLAPYVVDGGFSVRLTMSGEIPDSPWVMVVQACFHVSATVNYGQALAK